MSYYNNNRFTPGNKGNLRKYLSNQTIIHDYTRYIAFINAQLGQNILNADDITEGNLCQCSPQSKANALKQGYLDPSIPESVRISQRIQQSNLGGRITFGNRFKPVTVNYLGGWEGQPGGTFRPIRNKF
jgi:hypothetical protein